MHNGSDLAHTHTHKTAASAEETRALLCYLLDHNKHHAAELHDMAHDLSAAGNAEAAALLHAAVADFSSGNEKLQQALSQLEKE